ncbi:hypothetical protein FQA47_005798 [Oryzias melastigma]|uniref:Uncharacterized protein n=1 Tax=Oryzias melastigma TaxID=30732 RepID=A0A834FT56_ORYME|nr:hypothetical protein FQA47_005798 [Oryzias melastigma]
MLCVWASGICPFQEGSSQSVSSWSEFRTETTEWRSLRIETTPYSQTALIGKSCSPHAQQET